MTPSRGFLVIIGLLVVSLASLRSVPFMNPWGVDLLNIHLYHGCAHGVSPYSISAAACGDPYGRGMYYPPLLFYSFIWTRSLSLQQAMHVWSVVQLSLYAAVLYTWVRRICGQKFGVAAPGDVAVFGALLLVQFPLVFALERGGSDAWAVALVTVAALSMTRRHYVLAGAALGLATAYKLYPIFVCAVIVGGLLFCDWRQPLRSRQRLRFLVLGATAMAVFLLVALLFYADSKLYFTKVLPEFAKTAYTPGTIGHSVTVLAGGFPRFGALLLGLLLLLWAWAAGRAFSRADYAAGVAGALAISTYSQQTSWDYNLVTTYPLLMVMFLRARVDQRWWLLGLGLFSLVGERELYGTPGNVLFTPVLHVVLQLAFLVLSALVVAAESPAIPAARAHDGSKRVSASCEP